MRKTKILSLMLALLCAASVLTSCTNRENAGAQSAHAAITIQSPFRNMSAFIDVVHEKYPEINLEVVPYSGKNYSAYVKAQLAAGDMPDIYCTTFYTRAWTT